jgi:hypothetical protein
MLTNNNKPNDKELDPFIEHQIKLIKDLLEGEEILDQNLKQKFNKTCQINILNKEWLKKWKEIVGYEKIKEKCRKYSEKKNDNLKKELYDFFNTNSTKKKFEELGKMNFPNFKEDSNIENGNNILFNEKIDFIPMPDNYCSYLKKYIDNIVVMGNFNKGKCFLYNEINNDKNKKNKIKEKKILILEKKIGNNNDEFNALMVNLGEKGDIKTFINNVKNKTFEELMNDKNLKVEKREISQNKIK